MITASTAPPSQPASSPAATPRVTAKTTERAPTSSEMREPKRMADSMSLPWLSVPSRKSAVPPSIQDGGSRASSRLTVERSKGLCGATRPAKTAPRMMAAATSAETIATGECRKLQARSPSKRRRQNPGCDTARSATAGSRLGAEAQPRIDQVIEQIDGQIDDHEEERDQHQIGRHDRNIGESHGLDEHQPHPRPLEHGLGDDRERDQLAELETDHGHHR